MFTTVHYLTMLSQMLRMLQCSKQPTVWKYSEPNNTPVTEFTEVRRWPCSEPNITPVAVFTTFYNLIVFWVKWHTCYSVHNSQLLDNVLSQIIVCYCVQICPLLDHVLSQMLRLLLCSQQSTAWPCSEPNKTPVIVSKNVHCLTMFWAK
jgi:hypothetical protein